MPKISIITPVFIDIQAKVSWLDEMIQSVQSQTMVDWELILINDRSTLSLEPVRMRHVTDNRLRWLENAQNEGPAKTRNTAVALAESDCILPVDADDLLADNEVLEFMYDAWLMDRSKIIYGNLQLYTQITPDVFSRGRVIELGQYTFELAMNLGGLMPVTGMHSVECHHQSGGWKSELGPGLEDVEYWISAGKRGFCGQKIDHTTLVYRRQEESRAYKLKHVNQEFRAMQDKIKAMHSDIYKGEFPMACCGKGTSNVRNNPDPTILSQQSQTKEIRHITTLDNYQENDLEWVAYRGPKQGSAGRILVRGPANLPSEYPIMGNGHVFQIHKRHRKMFEDRQKLGFEMNQPDPRQQPEHEPVQVPMLQPEPQVIEVPKPELSTLVRLDNVGSQTRETEIQSPAIILEENEPRTIEQGFIGEIIIEPNAANSYSDTMVTQMPTDHLKSKPQASLHVSSLGLSKSLTEVLNQNGYTVEKLAEITIEELAALPGIGLKRGQTIIEKAKDKINEYK